MSLHAVKALISTVEKPYDISAHAGGKCIMTVFFGWHVTCPSRLNSWETKTQLIPSRSKPWSHVPSPHWPQRPQRSSSTLPLMVSPLAAWCFGYTPTRHQRPPRTSVHCALGRKGSESRGSHYILRTASCKFSFDWESHWIFLLKQVKRVILTFFFRNVTQLP